QDGPLDAPGEEHAERDQACGGDRRSGGVRDAVPPEGGHESDEGRTDREAEPPERLEAAQRGAPPVLRRTPDREEEERRVARRGGEGGGGCPGRKRAARKGGPAGLGSAAASPIPLAARRTPAAAARLGPTRSGSRLPRTRIATRTAALTSSTSPAPPMPSSRA